MTPSSTDTSAPPPARDVRLPWETVGADDAPAAELAPRPTAAPEAAAEAPQPTGAPQVSDVPQGATGASGERGGPPPGDAVEEETAGSVDYESPVRAEPLVDDLGPPPPGGGVTLVLLCVGIAILACCVLIPQADANRRMAYEREKLKLDLESVRKQVATNDEFLKRVADDPNLAERLAQRQIKMVREGTRVLELKKQKHPVGTTGDVPTSGLADEMSPFHLVHVAPPPPLPPYQPKGGLLAGLCYNPHTRLYLTGLGLLLMAAGLVMGAGPKP